MSWFKQAGLWLGKREVEEQISVETAPRHLLASLLAMGQTVLCPTASQLTARPRTD